MNPPERVCALTGATGYVGSILRPALESAGWRTIALSRGASQDDDDTIAWSLDRDAAEAGQRGSGMASNSIEAALKKRKVSALVHAAWDLSLTRPKDVERVNVVGSLRLLAAARAAEIKRIVFVSTISSYEGARSHYGRSKLAIERAVAELGGFSLRPGLVYGKQPRGMFGALQHQVSSSSVIPLIGNGSFPQYMLHEDDLAAAVLRAASIEEMPKLPVTVAHPRPWAFRALVEEIARTQGKTPKFVPLPWPFVYAGLKLAESIGFKAPFRSDSVLSLVHQNPHPEWNANLLGIQPRPFSATTA